MLSLARSIPAADAVDESAASGKRRSSRASSCAARRSASSGSGASARRSAPRARAFGMELVAHDPFISEQVAGDAGHPAARRSTICAPRPTSSRCTCRRTPETRHLFNAARLARCKPGVRIVNTARGELIDEARARRRDRGAATSPAPASTCSKASRRPTGGWRSCRRSSRRRTSPRPRSRRRSRSGIETAVALRDFLQEGVIRNAVNFPRRSRRGIRRACARSCCSAERMGALVAQLADGRTQSVGIRYYGPLVTRARRT